MNRTFAWVGWLGLWTVAVGTAQPTDPQPEKLLPPEQILEVLTSSKSSNEAKKLALASVAPDGGMNEPIYRQIGRRLLEMLNVPKETPLTPDIIAALARLGRWEFDLVKDGLTWQSWQVRRDTALALGLMDEFGLEAIPNLAALANDPDWPVRQAVANALGRLLKADAERQSSYANHRKALIGLAKDRVWNVRMTALNSLGEIDSEALGVTVIKQIESATQDNEWPVRKAAVVALGKLKAKRSLPVLLALAKPPGDPHPEVRDAAKEAVRLIDSDEAIRQGLIEAPKKE